MSSMLRKGAMSFKPKARPNATRPSSSQPATRPSSETQLQKPVSATQPTNPIPTSTENVVEKDASLTTTSQPIQAIPESQPTPPAQPQTILTTSNNVHGSAIDNTAKRKVREEDVETAAQMEQPPLKARKLTPPSDELQNSEQEHAANKELPSLRPSITKNATNGDTVPAKPSSTSTSAIPATISQINTTIDKPQSDSLSIDAEVAEQNDQAQSSQAALLSATGAPVGPGQVLDGSIQTTPASSDDVDLSGMGAGEASETSHLVSTATPTSEETPTPVDEEAAPAPKKSRKKAAPKKKKVQVEDGEEPRTEVEIQLNRPRRTPGQKRERKKKDDSGAVKRRKDREVTPEDAENEVIEPATMKMGDLCKDIRIGKKFSRHDEIKLRHSRKKVDAQLAERPELAGLINNAPAEVSAEPREEPAEEPASITSNNGVQMRVIDGQIVLDDRSLQVDRQRQARDEGLVLEEIEENEFTRAVNSGQYMKRTAAVRWDSNANELFYQGLRQFGTAFEMIAAMFPDRNRRQIKLKFVREERQNPAKVDRALKGKTDEIDFDEYSQLTGQKFEDSAAIQAEHQRLEDEHNAETEKVAAAKMAADKKKKEAIAAAARRGQGGAIDGDDGPESQKENAGSAFAGGKKKPARSKKSNKASMQGGGEEIEIIGTV
ncbi:hypothetical protein NHQ30_005593 [Ciborinia camelliae]|nr:hypothetical protein NHQ30_005593 [Ciborinia camelliae]